MKQMIEKFVNVTQLGSYYTDLVNFMSYIVSKYGTAFMAATPYVILGSIFIWMYVKGCWRSNRGPPSRRPHLTRSKSLAKLHGGDLVLKRRSADHAARANPATLDGALVLLDALLKQEHLNFKNMQKNPVTKLEMSEREKEAIEVLNNAKEARKDQPHEVYEIEMLLVEMLIYKGDYNQAWDCKCLSDGDITDARRPFFKAIIHMLRDKKESKAKKCWEDFIEIKPTPFMHPLEGDYDKIDFEEFKRKVKDLEFAISGPAEKKEKAKK